MSDSQRAPDGIDHFISVARRISGVPVLADHPAAEDDLYTIAGKLLAANENMARWLNRFVLLSRPGGRHAAMAASLELRNADANMVAFIPDNDQ